MMPGKFSEHSSISSSVSSGQSSQSVVLGSWVLPRAFQGTCDFRITFVTTIRCYLHFPLTFLHGNSVEFPADSTGCHHSRLNAEAGLRIPLSSFRPVFKNICKILKQFHSFHYIYFCFGIQAYFFIKMFYLYEYEFIIFIFNELLHIFKSICFHLHVANVNRYNPHKLKLFGTSVIFQGVQEVLPQIFDYCYSISPLFNILTQKFTLLKLTIYLITCGVCTFHNFKCM